MTDRSRPDPAQLRSAHDRTLRLATDVIAGVSAAALERPTPCGQWSLRQLLEHMVGQNHGFAQAAGAASSGSGGGTQGGGELADWAPRPVGGDPVTAWTESATAVRAALAQLPDGAGLLMPEVRPVALPAAVAISFHFLDTLVHGWDVAVASGQPFSCPDELAGPALAVAALVPTAPEARQPGAAFLLALDDSPFPQPFDRTLARLGRDPKWGPPDVGLGQNGVRPS